eukprot:TRINITY_DN3163_c0_g1_i1.p2 TRINITY_DN3163_c0_g1~~TRINITY_DN3163_c0_g1_i1.p2  ORF type:complete len:455 (+),score=102.64 TRINITY_DN3163_c0_g1_i1:702-2066(+)
MGSNQTKKEISETYTISSTKLQQLTELTSNLRGHLISQTDTEKYEALRKLIIQCIGSSDVVIALQISKLLDLPISVRGGGHSIVGYGVVDDGLVIDLSLMRSVHVDPQRMVAVADGGCLLRDIDRECAIYGLGVPTGLVSHTGLGGLTLGGGIGWLSRSYGLTCDSLISATVVMADGHVVQASEEENEDLFWALQGGGGNFGVVTSMTFLLHNIGDNGKVGFVRFIYKFEKFKSVMRLYNNIASDPETSTDLSIFGFLTNQYVQFYCCYNGSLEEAKSLLTPFQEADPLTCFEEELLYVDLQSKFDEGNLSNYVYWSPSSYYEEIPEEMIDTLYEQLKKIPYNTNIEIAHLGGAISSRTSEGSAYFYRSPLFEIHSISSWSYSEETLETFRPWGKSTFQALEPFSCKAGYTNFIQDPENPTKVQQAYASNYPKLKSLKTKYDPENIFNNCSNIT